MLIDRSVATRTLRLALGTSLAFGVGQFAGWRMAFLAPVLAVLLLKAPQRPTLKSGVGLVLVIAGTFSLVLAVVLPLLQYPIPVVLFLSLALFWTFYLGRRGGPPFAVLMMLVALTLVPLLGLESIDLSFEVAGGVAQAGLIAVLFAMLAFALIQAPPAQAPPARAGNTAIPDTGQNVRLAWVSTAVVVPALIAFLVFGLSSYALVLVFITLLAMEPDVSAGLKGSLGLIAGNALGGAIAIVVYELFIIYPNLLFLTLLIALVCLVLGPRIFSGGVAGALCGTALSAVLLIIGMTVSPIGPEADAKSYSRIIQVITAALYVVAAFVLADLWLQRDDRPRSELRQTTQ